jgi:hypothetical protein
MSPIQVSGVEKRIANLNICNCPERRSADVRYLRSDVRQSLDKSLAAHDETIWDHLGLRAR